MNSNRTIMNRSHTPGLVKTAESKDGDEKGSDEDSDGESEDDHLSAIAHMPNQNTANATAEIMDVPKDLTAALASTEHEFWRVAIRQELHHYMPHGIFAKIVSLKEQTVSVIATKKFREQIVTNNTTTANSSNVECVDDCGIASVLMPSEEAAHNPDCSPMDFGGCFPTPVHVLSEETPHTSIGFTYCVFVDTCVTTPVLVLSEEALHTSNGVTYCVFVDTCAKTPVCVLSEETPRTRSRSMDFGSDCNNNGEEWDTEVFAICCNSEVRDTEVSAACHSDGVRGTEVFAACQSNGVRDTVVFATCQSDEVRDTVVSAACHNDGVRNTEVFATCHGDKVYKR